jgi:hypothetical protein
MSKTVMDSGKAKVETNKPETEEEFVAKMLKELGYGFLSKPDGSTVAFVPEKRRRA